MLKNYLNVDPTGRHPRTSTPQPTEVNEVFQPEDATRLVNWEIVEGEEVLDEQQKREDAQTAQMSETPDELVAQINAGKLKPTKSFLKRYELAYNRDFVKRWDAGQAALLKSTK